MKIDAGTGLLDAARFCESPNQDGRPRSCAVDLVVLHNISLPPGVFDGDCIELFFTNRLDCTQHPYFAQLSGVKVSAHLLIRRDGVLIQFVPLHRRAWHAGVSHHDGRDNCNDFSIGIELEGRDETPYTAAQYDALGQVVSLLLNTYPRLTPERIVGHSDVAPGRKTDPGAAFDWRRLRRILDKTQRTTHV